MKEKPPTRLEKKGKTSAAALAKEWERKLTQEGLTAEPGEDKGAATLRAEIGAEEEVGVTEETILQKLQEYFLRRPEHLGKHVGLHRQIAEDVAHELGVSTDEVPVDLIDVAAEELMKVERRVRQIVDSRSGQAVRFHYDKMNNLIARELGGEYADFSPMGLQMIISRVLEE